MTIEPIGPDEAKTLKITAIPDQVIAAVNQLILEKTNKQCYFSIKQKDIVTKASELLNAEGVSFTRSDFFERGWLDFETIYEKAGWTVSYDKPGWDENYDAFYHFSKKKSS